MAVQKTIFIITMFALMKGIAACPAEDQIPGEYLIRETSLVTLSNQTTTKLSSLSDRGLYGRCLNCHSGAAMQKNPRVQLLKLAPNVSPSRLHLARLSAQQAREISQDPRVLSVEPNCRVNSLAGSIQPNDPLYAQQWSLPSISANSAWVLGTGSKAVVVAVSDSGVDYNHPDLRNQMWQNTAEKNGSPGVDDDGNGCIDDINGCDLADGDGNPMPGTASSSGHGTHVAGIIGAIGNNAVGVSGVAWNVSIMAVKGFYDADSSTTLSALLETIYYAVDNGADVINCSWGSQNAPTQAERDAFAYARSHGVSVVVAAGNAGVDASGFSPAGISQVLTVGSFNGSGRLSSFSNFGSIIDLVAPGGDALSSGGYEETILSTVPVREGSYAGIQGTSMAAPHVAGTIALMLSIYPSLTVDAVETILAQTADRVLLPSQKGNLPDTVYNKLNAFAAVERTFQLANCSGENCSLSGGFYGSSSDLGAALTSGMGGCNMGIAKEASLHQILITLIILTLPLLSRLILFKR